MAPQAVFTLGDAQSIVGLTSKIPPLGPMVNFDADVTNVNTASGGSRIRPAVDSTQVLPEGPNSKPTKNFTLKNLTR